MTEAPSVLIINGPNLNLLGTREPEIYGRDTLTDIEAHCRARAAELGMSVDFLQSNSEGELVTWIQDARGRHDAIIINPGAYSHTSIAILDAMQAVDLPVLEVHLSNTQQREAFRHHSYVSRVATGIISGFGADGYVMAVEAAARMLKNR